MNDEFLNHNDEGMTNVECPMGRPGGLPAIGSAQAGDLLGSWHWGFFSHYDLVIRHSRRLDFAPLMWSSKRVTMRRKDRENGETVRTVREDACLTLSRSQSPHALSVL